MKWLGTVNAKSVKTQLSKWFQAHGAIYSAARVLPDKDERWQMMNDFDGDIPLWVYAARQR